MNLRKPAAVLFCLALMSSAACAQSYPSKPIKMYTQFGPGTPGDVLGRIVAEQMQRIMGQPVVVDSRPGGGGMLVGGLLARAEPDGYTVAALTSSIPVINAVLRKDMPFDPAKDYTPVTSLVNIPTLIGASLGFAPNNLKEVLDYARANPGKISYGTTGVGSSHHLNGVQIDLLAGTRMVHVPYKTSPILDAAAGVLPLAYAVAPQTVALIKSGKLKPIAMISEARWKLLPDVPIVSETLPGFEPVPAWTGLFAPAGLPRPVFERLYANTVAAITSPEGSQQLGKIGFDVVPSKSADAFAAQVKRETELVRKLAKEGHVELE
jgi:tripartite-type tricarboxylate transporter receptor subunit TctC